MDASILDCGTGLCVDTSRLHRLHNCAGYSKVGYGYAVREDVRGTCSIGGKVDNVVALDESGVLQSWLDNEHAVLYEHVLVGDRRLLKLAISVEGQNRFHCVDTSILTQIHQPQLPVSRLQD